MTHSNAAVALDHDYCAPVIAKEGAAKEVESVSRETVVLSTSHDQVLNASTTFSKSSPSPAHSSDSGMDNEFDAILANLGIQNEDFLDIDDLDRLLENDDMASRETPTFRKPATNKALLSQKGRSSSSNTDRTVKNTTRKPFVYHLDDEEEQIWLLDRGRKNALYARENRQKKKKYVSGLEVEVSELRRENVILKEEAEEMQGKFSKLEEEITYLKNVLANQSTISLLLKGIAATPGISLSSSLVSRSRGQDPEQNEDDETTRRKYRTRSRKRAGDTECLDSSKKKKKVGGGGSGGVCLHINQDRVSLELCSQCSIKAQQNGWK